MSFQINEEMIHTWVSRGLLGSWLLYATIYFSPGEKSINLTCTQESQRSVNTYTASTAADANSIKHPQSHQMKKISMNFHIQSQNIRWMLQIWYIKLKMPLNNLNQRSNQSKFQITYNVSFYFLCNIAIVQLNKVWEQFGRMWGALNIRCIRKGDIVKWTAETSLAETCWLTHNNNFPSERWLLWLGWWAYARQNLPEDGYNAWVD